MAIARVGGNSANSSVAVALLALPAYSSTSGNDILFSIVLGSTTSSVSSITNVGGTYAAPVFIAAINNANGTVRTELWRIHVTTGASTTFTINIGGVNTKIAVGFEEYSGVSSFGNTSTKTDTSTNLRTGYVQTQNGNNWVVGALGFACQSGDTLTAQVGASQQSSIPAATAVGAALYDISSVPNAQLQCMAKISTSRDWTAAAVELQSGGATINIVDYAATLAVSMGTKGILGGITNFTILHILEPKYLTLTPTTTTPAPVAVVLAQGAVGFAYSETISAVNGTAPYTFSVTVGTVPTGTSLNGSTGVISGTPSAAGTYTFTVKVTDTNGNTGTQAFSITIISPIIAGGTWGYVA